MSKFLIQLEDYLKSGLINSKLYHVIQNFYENYQQSSAHLPYPEKRKKIFELLVQLIIEQIQHPYTFSIFHRSIRQPFDYYQFGLDFIRPFIDFAHSKILGLDFFYSIQQQLKKGDNVILFANHQTEPDPQIISLLLEKIDLQLAADMIFVAGHRVTTDPLAIPMSLGRNLLCIYSKKHMSDSIEKKSEKILHNQRTLKQMQELLNEGGYCIYVAPSGGRDRLNNVGNIQVTPFDSQSVELFWLLGHNAEHLTHFYPFALKTYSLMPPPYHVEKELGERRIINYTPVYLAFGQEIDMEHFPENLDKKTKRIKRADYIWQQVCQSYQLLSTDHTSY